MKFYLIEGPRLGYTFHWYEAPIGFTEIISLRRFYNTNGSIAFSSFPSTRRN